MTEDRYRNEILQHYITPHINASDGLFQHDNAGTNVARVCEDFRQQNYVLFLFCPARTPDLSSMKHR